MQIWNLIFPSRRNAYHILVIKMGLHSIHQHNKMGLNTTIGSECMLEEIVSLLDKFQEYDEGSVAQKTMQKWNLIPFLHGFF